MAFFEDIDTLSILERNSDKLEGLQMNSARKLLIEYKRAREELKARLLMTPSGTFTEARMSATLVQLEASIAQLDRQINPLLRSFFDVITESGIEDSAKEVNAMEKLFMGASRPIDIDAVMETTDPSNFLFNQFESSVSTYNEQLRNGFQQSLTQALLQQKSWSQAVWDMEQVFGQSEYILSRIVRTELHGIYSGAKFNGMLNIRDNYLPDMMKTLYHPMDSRTGDDSKKAAELNLIVPLDEPFKYSYKGKERVFFLPPDRPNDRSILIPYRRSYEK